LDRISTWDEVRIAMSILSQAGFAAGDCNDAGDEDTDLSGGVSKLLEDVMWLAMVHEMPNSKSN
jgi:hypothetical protein